jgi:hypothetical protein
MRVELGLDHTESGDIEAPLSFSRLDRAVFCAEARVLICQDGDELIWLKCNEDGVFDDGHVVGSGVGQFEVNDSNLFARSADGSGTMLFSVSRKGGAALVRSTPGRTAVWVGLARNSDTRCVLFSDGSIEGFKNNSNGSAATNPLNVFKVPSERAMQNREPTEQEKENELRAEGLREQSDPVLKRFRYAESERAESLKAVPSPPTAPASAVPALQPPAPRAADIAASATSVRLLEQRVQSLETLITWMQAALRRADPAHPMLESFKRYEDLRADQSMNL